jgi:hypothetical protein
MIEHVPDEHGKNAHDANGSNHSRIGSELEHDDGQHNTVDLFGLNTKEFAKKPADGFILLKNNFDIIVINSSMTGNNCNSLKEVLDESKNLNVKGANRSDNWIDFVFKLLYGIDIAKYDSYLFSYPKNISTNRNLFAYEKISNSIKKTKASKCNF